jgi:hypothetical protein
MYQRLVVANVAALLWATAALAVPKAGTDFIWVDLGKKEEGLLLTQSEQADGVTKPETVKGVDCRENPWPYNGPGHNHMYFKVDDSFLFGGKTEAWIVMEYFDSLAAPQINCQYDSTGAGPVGGAFRGAQDGAFEMLKPQGTETWRVHVWHIKKDGRFENRANGSDFRFTSHGQGPIWINRVWFSLVEPPQPFNVDEPFGVPRAVSPRGKSAAVWAAVKEGRF